MRVSVWIGSLILPWFWTFGESNFKYSPRISFSASEISLKRFPLPENDALVQIVLQRQNNAVTAVGRTHVYKIIQNPQKAAAANRTVIWKNCGSQNDCSYNITMVHQRQHADQLFVCGTKAAETFCCDMDLHDDQPLSCRSSESTKNIQHSIRTFTIKEGEPSALFSKNGDESLYITHSGSQGQVGIHKFGKDRVGPSKSVKEQYYLDLVISRREDSLQDKVYAFYKEKNTKEGLLSDLWLPFVTQVCMADIGGPKNQLQFKWTSEMHARLFCGNASSKQHFSELVDVSTVQAERWQDTRVYALFRNEWNMSAVCVYTIKDINQVFMKSPFKGNQADQKRKCVEDSTKFPLDVMVKIEKASELEDLIHPVHNSGPLLMNHHIYTRIHADSSQKNKNEQHTVLFLALNNGAIHKVIETPSQAIVIAEYHQLNPKDHILSIILQPTSKMLYVNSRRELIQLHAANCSKYGDTCEDCVLARDPYCGWNGTKCTAETHETLQNVSSGNYAICRESTKKALRSTHERQTGGTTKTPATVRLPGKAKYFLQCPMTSKHAKYTWHHNKETKTCRSTNQDCLFLIDSMAPQQEGSYRCESKENGYTKVLAQVDLQLDNEAPRPPSVLAVCLSLLAALLVLM
ncbi:semaphorin-7A [Echeneis naucrates]|uniref:Semaphorin-7A-like n=1 Tax=Echeneis naucrates TaxID=173247 RepID=A0A665VXV8_ECHNA|nr:semaphorin-7A-like [Echeneis naucrates]